MNNIEKQSENIESTTSPDFFKEFEKEENIKKDKENDALQIIGILNLATLLTGIFGMLGTIFYYISKKEELSESEIRAIKDNLNFHFSFWLYLLISILLTVILIGLLGIFIFGIVYFIQAIIASVKLFKGENYKYFWTIKFM